jgi:hypothetical protein
MQTIFKRSSRILLVSLSPLLLVSSSPALADIFQWEYINPADPSQGKQQSTTLAPDGAGVSAVRGANLHGRDLTMAYLMDADLSEATLTDADFTDAHIIGANFSIHYYNIIPGVAEYSRGTGIAPAQLYSTASYYARDLRGIKLELNDLVGTNFARQNLAYANFAAAGLASANFRGANLANTEFAVASQCHPFSCGTSRFALLTNADLTAADGRGAHISTWGAITSNFIQPDGHIIGLDLQADGLLVVRDYDGNPNSFPPNVPIPITVDQHLAMGPGGALRMVFEADAWDSTISFAPGIPVTLGGTLELTFADDVNLASQVGRTLKIFDWTGVTPTDGFAVSSPYAWDLSNLYTNGQVTFTAIPEPASVSLAVLLLLSLFVHLRRRRQLN